MSKFFKAFFGGVSLVIIYVIAILVAPIIMFLLGYSEVDSKPAIFNFPLYIVEVRGEEFFSEATPTGLLLSLILGISLYYLFPLLISKKWSRRNE